jgi:hypothetical protein
MAPIIPLLLKLFPTVMLFIRWAGDLFRELSKKKAIQDVRNRKENKDRAVDDRLSALLAGNGLHDDGSQAGQQQAADGKK